MAPPEAKKRQRATAEGKRSGHFDVSGILETWKGRLVGENACHKAAKSSKLREI
jgi:hypothetical protein